MPGTGAVTAKINAPIRAELRLADRKAFGRFL